MAPLLRPSPQALTVRDAVGWALLSALLLAALPIGYVSADGLGQSFLFAAGARPLNPNHLLYEPLATAWLRLLGPHVGSTAPVAPEAAIDWLKRLSILAGAVAVGLFRAGVAPRLANSRAAANHATAWLAGSSAFSRLWISDEVQMVQMPAVVLVAALAVRALDTAEDSRGLRGPGLLWSLATGAGTGLAAAFFASNLLLAPALALASAAAFLRERRPRQALTTALGIAFGAGVSAGLIFTLAWRLSGSADSLLAWATRYTGGDLPARVALAYGLVRSAPGMASAALRALYGAACSLVDLAPAVAAWRESGLARAAALGIGMALAAGALLVGLRERRQPPPPAATGSEEDRESESESRRRDRDALVLAAAWLLAILTFGFLWDNSDDQFYFQLAVAWGALAARVPMRPRKTLRPLARRVPAVLALSALALTWNVGDLALCRVFYPRAERVDLLRRELAGAGLIVNSGFDDLDVLLTLTGLERTQRIRLAPLAVELAPQQGLARLASAIEATLATGRPVALLDLYDTPAAKNPWKFLHRLGYERRDVLATVGRFPVAARSQRIGPFTLRWIRPPHGPGPRYHRPPEADA